jgi:hypothetical protein
VIAVMFKAMKAILVSLVVMALLVCGGCSPENVVSLTSISPDSLYKVELVELDNFDRNFSVRLTHVNSNVATNIFDSPDEGRPIGTERIVWSQDSSQFLLLGRHFYVVGNAKPDKREAAYLTYEIKTGRLRCNARQQNQYPNLTREDLKAVAWNEGFKPD